MSRKVFDCRPDHPDRVQRYRLDETELVVERDGGNERVLWLDVVEIARPEPDRVLIVHRHGRLYVSNTWQPMAAVMAALSRACERDRYLRQQGLRVGTGPWWRRVLPDPVLGDPLPLSAFAPAAGLLALAGVILATYAAAPHSSGDLVVPVILALVIAFVTLFYGAAVLLRTIGEPREAEGLVLYRTKGPLHHRNVKEQELVGWHQIASRRPDGLLVRLLLTDGRVYRVRRGGAVDRAVKALLEHRVSEVLIHDGPPASDASLSRATGEPETAAERGISLSDGEG